MWNKFTRHHVSMYCLTFFSFSLYHATRKAFSNVKDSLSKEWTSTSCNTSWPCPYPCKTWSSHHLFKSYQEAEPFLGNLDTAFLFAYALGLFVSGAIGDRYQLRIVLAVGMWLSSTMVFIFGTLTEWLHFYNKPFYLVIWTLNGLFQSSGWPSVVAIVGNWFGKSGRGFLFGIWSSCASVGNIIGSAIAGSLIDYGYEVVFLYASVTLFGGGFIAYFGIINSPSEIGLEDPNAIPDDPITDDLYSSDKEYDAGEQEIDSYEYTNHDHEVLLADDFHSKPISFCRAILLPGVINYSILFAAIKLINYSLILWLPYYLTNNFGLTDSEADRLSVCYDIGSIIGGIVFGFLSDWLEIRSPVLFLMMIAAPFSIWGYQLSPPNIVINAVLMSVLGIFVGGCSNIVGTAVTTDIGKQKSIGKNTNALATVTGIIDGTGSVGAGIGQFLVTLLQSRSGWSWVFYSFIIESCIALICLIRPVYIEMRTWPPAKTLVISWNRFRASRSATTD